MFPGVLASREPSQPSDWTDAGRAFKAERLKSNHIDMQTPGLDPGTGKDISKNR